MQNNFASPKDLKKLKNTLSDISSVLSQIEIEEIQISESLYVYFNYVLEDDILYESNIGEPIGYVFGTPVEINSSLKDFNWLAIPKQKNKERRLK